MTESGRRWVLPAVAAALLLGVYVTGASASYFRPQDSAVAFWWPAAGLAVALVAVMPRRWAPGLAAGIVVMSTAANLTGGQTLALSACFGVGNAAEALVAGLLLKDRSGRLRRLHDLSDFARLVLAVLAGAAVLAGFAGAGVAALGQPDFLPTARNLLVSHTAAVILIVSVAMTWRHRSAPAGRIERTVQATSLVCLTVVLFAPQHDVPLSFAILPVLVWGALRLDAHTVSLELLGVSSAAVLLTAQGHGPFGHIGADGVVSAELAAPLVQGYIFAITLVTLPLTLVVTQLAQALEVLTDRERLFRRNFTESMTGMLLLEPRGDRLEIIDANETAEQLLGSGRSVIGQPFDEMLVNRATMRSLVQEMLDGELEGWRGQVALAARPDSHVKVAISPLSLGPDPTFSAQLLDVSAEYAALARTAAAERLTSATLDTASCIILVTDLAGTVVRANRATTTLTGFAEDEIVGRPLWETIVPPHRTAEVRAQFESGEESELRGSVEANVQTVNGEPLRVVWNTELVRDGDGNPRYAVRTGVDVTAERTTAGLMTTLFQAGISTAIIGIDSRGQVTLFNSGAQSLLGWAPEEVRGTPFIDLLDPDELAERTSSSDGSGWSALTSIIEEGRESQVRDWTWLTATGARRTVSMSLSGGGSQFGPQAGYLVVGRDVTEQRHSQMMLMAALEKERMAADRLRQLDTAKNEFVSTVSHELRTPVTSIVGYAELLADGSPVPPDPQQLPLLDIIARNGERLISLCNDLLTLAGLDSEGPVWNRRELDLRDLVAQAEDALRPMVRDRDLKMTFTVPDEPVRMLGDGIQLERVLLNLLSNALKFTPEGGQVTTTLSARDGEAWLEVADTGIGIPHEEQDALFQKFFRATTAQDLAIQGTGLGLSIVAGIVAVHGGRIAVDSEPGRGTAFTVRLPLARD